MTFSHPLSLPPPPSTAACLHSDGLRTVAGLAGDDNPHVVVPSTQSAALALVTTSSTARTGAVSGDCQPVVVEGRVVDWNGLGLLWQSALAHLGITPQAPKSLVC